MSGLREANAFSGAFMRGFSFIDDYKSRQRQEKKLELALAEERRAREFQRMQQRDRAKREAELHDLSVENELTRRQRQVLEDEAAGLVASGAELNDEQLRKYAPHSPEIMAEASRRQRMGRLSAAAQNVSSIPHPQQNTAPQGLSDMLFAASQGGAGVQGGGSKTPPEAAAEESAEMSQSLFAPSRGTDTLKRVTEEDISAFDPEYQNKGLGERALDVVAGQFQQLGRGVSNIAQRAAGPGSPPASRQPVGAAFAGDAFIDSEYVTLEEFNEIEDPQKRAAVRARNAEIIDAYTKAARDPARNKLSRPITRQGAVQEGGELALAEAKQYEQEVSARYDAFMSSQNSALEEIAATNPPAAATVYFQDRATLRAARGEDYVSEVDKRMVPVLDRYAEQIRTEMNKHQPGSAEFRREQRRLKEVHASRNQIAADQPSVAHQAGINSRGLKLGDTQRGNAVTTIAFDPSRPRAVPGTVSASAVNTALTVSSRIGTGTRRLNEKQIESLITLVDEGLVDKQTMTTVLATGAWPAGKDPNAIKSMMAHGDYLYGVTEGGRVQLIASTKKSDESGNLPSQEITAEVLGDIVTGAKLITPDMTPQAEGAVSAFVSQQAGYIRENFAITSEEQRLLLGQIIQQSLFLSRANIEENYNNWWEPNAKNAPTPREVFMQPEIRAKLAQEFNTPLIELPARIVDGEGIDWERVRQSVRNGDLAEFNIMPEDADKLNDANMAYIIALLRGTPEQLEAYHAEATRGQ